MKTERFIVKKVVKFGMLFGYVVYDTKEKRILHSNMMRMSCIKLNQEQNYQMH